MDKLQQIIDDIKKEPPETRIDYASLRILLEGYLTGDFLTIEQIKEKHRKILAREI